MVEPDVALCQAAAAAILAAAGASIAALQRHLAWRHAEDIPQVSHGVAGFALSLLGVHC